MTVIAWDGNTLAADSMVSDGYLAGRSVKLTEHRRKGRRYLMAGTGTSRAIRAVRHWFITGADPKNFPKVAMNDDDFSRFIVVDCESATVRDYQSTHIPCIERAVPFAWGCGREAAMGAMAHGATATQAVETACKLIKGCGGPVVSLSRHENLKVIGEFGFAYMDTASGVQVGPSSIDFFPFGSNSLQDESAA